MSPITHWFVAVSGLLHRYHSVWENKHRTSVTYRNILEIQPLLV